MKSTVPSKESREYTYFLAELKEALMQRAIKLAEHNRVVAETIVVSVLAAVHFKCDEIVKENFRKYSFTALTNAFRDYWRSANKKRTIDINNDKLAGFLPKAGINDTFSAKEKESRLKKIDLLFQEVLTYLATLDESYQKTFTLYFIKKLKHRQIAEIRGISIEHSRQDVKRLRQKMQLRFQAKISFLNI